MINIISYKDNDNVFKTDNWVYWKIFIVSDEKVHCVWFYIIILNQRLFYLLFPINYFLKIMYRISFILGVYSLKWNVQNKVPLVCICVHSPEMKYTKPSHRCLHLTDLRRNTVGKNTIYSYTRTLISQKFFSQFTFNGQNFFSG